jgi:hypothetical protein
MIANECFSSDRRDAIHPLRRLSLRWVADAIEAVFKKLNAADEAEAARRSRRVNRQCSINRADPCCTIGRKAAPLA